MKLLPSVLITICLLTGCGPGKATIDADLNSAGALQGATSTLLLSTLTPTTKSTATPILPTPTLAPIKITAQNIDRIEVLNQWGKGYIRSLQFNTGGMELLMGTSMGVYFLDWRTGEEIKKIALPDDYRGMQFIPEKSLITIGKIGSISFYNSITGSLTSEIYSFRTYFDNPHVDPSNDNIFAISEANGNVVAIWDRSLKEEIHRFYGHYDEVTDLTFCGNSEIIYSASKDKTIIGWDVVDKKRLKTYTGFEGPVNQVLCSNDGQYLTGFDNTGLIQVWNLNTQTRLSIKLDREEISQMTLGNQKPYLALATKSGTIHIYNLEDGSIVTAINNKSSYGLYTAFSPDDSILAGSFADGKIYFWDISTGDFLIELGGYTLTTTNPQISPDSKYLAVGIFHDVKIFDSTNLKEFQSLPENYGARELKFSSDGKYLASFNDGGSTTIESEVAIYDMESGSLKWILPTNIGGYATLEYSRDNNWLAVWGINQKVIIEIWDLDSGSLLKSINMEDCYDVAFSNDGSHIAAGFRTRLSVWDTSTWKEIKRFDLKKYYAGTLDFSEDGKTISVEAYRIQDKMDGVLTINIETGEITPGDTFAVNDFLFDSVSPDGTLALMTKPSCMLSESGLHCPGLMIYNNSTKNLLREVEIPARRIKFAIFSPDQYFIYLVTIEGPIYQLGLIP